MYTYLHLKRWYLIYIVITHDVHFYNILCYHDFVFYLFYWFIRYRVELFWEAYTNDKIYNLEMDPIDRVVFGSPVVHMDGLLALEALV